MGGTSAVRGGGSGFDDGFRVLENGRETSKIYLRERFERIQHNTFGIITLMIKYGRSVACIDLCGVELQRKL
jgi:hypothetical protein